MELINWNEKQSIASKMTDTELHYAILDCLKTIQVMGNSQMNGKDQGYYYDELSVYRGEQRKRGVSGTGL